MKEEQKKQILEMNEKQKKRIEDLKKEQKDVSISKVTTEDWERIKEHADLKTSSLNFKIQFVVERDVVPFYWDEGKPENQQCDEYMSHLASIINLPETMEWYNAQNEKNFLTVLYNDLLPFGIRGTTDVAIIDKTYIRDNIHSSGIRLVMELKKKVIKSNIYQAAVELIVADLHSNFNIMAVITDLNDRWEFFWLKARKIHTYTSTSKEEAVFIIENVLNPNIDVLDNNGVKKFDFPMEDRDKLPHVSSQNYDVANLNDVADVMSEEEIRHWEVKHALRDFFAMPSAQSVLLADTNINDKLPFYT